MQGSEHRRWFNDLLRRNPTLQNVSEEDKQRIQNSRYTVEDVELDEDDGEAETDYTLLHHAAEISNPIVVRKLISEFGMDPNARASLGTMPMGTAMIPANSPRKTETVRVLLEGGADVNAVLDGQRTGLEQALMSRDSELVDLFLLRGADPNVKDTFGQTAIFNVRTVPHIDKLVTAGADVNVKDQNGQTALYNSILYGGPQTLNLVKKLVSVGLDWESVDNRGHSAETFALANRRPMSNQYLSELRKNKEAEAKRQRASDVRGASEVAVQKGLPSTALKSINEYLVGAPVQGPAPSKQLRAQNAERMRSERAEQREQREMDASAETVAAMKAGRKTRARLTRKTKRRKTLRRK